MPSSPAINSETPASPGFNGFDAVPISLPGISPAKPSSSCVTPKEWNDLPALSTLKTTLSPTLMLIVGLLSLSPGNALNAKVLKSGDSIKLRSFEIVSPV